MQSPPQAATDKRTAEPRDRFSLVAGGPLFQLLLRTRLARPGMELAHRRMLVIPAVAWLPLLVLTLWESTATEGVVVPFLADVEAYARFLVALPMLLLAEQVVHGRLNRIIVLLRERNIVASGSRDELEQAIANAIRLRNSVTAEVLLALGVFVGSPVAWSHGLALHADTWYARVADGGLELSGAGTWFVHVSAPVFQFMLLRWYYRLAIWWWFLSRVSRLPLELRPLHPDRAGGIGFLSDSIVVFAPVLVAQATVVSGIIFSRILTGAGTAMDYRGEVAVLIVFLVAQIITPLLFFSNELAVARLRTQRRFGLLASIYATDFDRKWLAAESPVGETLLGSGDIQSLADLAGSYDVLREMRSVPFSMRALFQLAVTTSVPFLPLILTVVPFGELMRRLVEMLL